ncbi:mechanosensitive ion channel family protein [Metabacillus litoralis]|uniref:mechanosensitive ion channel family protein n=1 Tax=Metabacillus litoralis TaxID=152268 RepID=UPI001CFED86F|nr:mechanosensitive ion channel domain-containing protein [Metabacillus litoralis]
MELLKNANWFKNFNYNDLFIIVAVITGILLVRVLFLWSAKKLPKYYDATRSIVNWFTFYGSILFVLIYFSKADWMFASFFTVGKVKVTLFLIIVAILIVSLASRVSKISTSVLLPTIYSRYNLDRGMRFTFDRIIHYAIMIIAIIISLTTVGIDLSALTVFAGIISVGIGFGLQNIASNFISGIILLFERPIKVGDRVIVDDIIGDVEKINMRATIIKTLNNEHIIVPNSYFLEEKVVNRSFADPRLRLVIPIGVAYGTDVEKVREYLLQVAAQESEVSPVVLKTPDPFVNFVGFGESSLDFELFVWIADPNQFIVIKSNLNFRINSILSENNIEIPFPQRDLHLKSFHRDVREKFDGFN